MTPPASPSQASSRASSRGSSPQASSPQASSPQASSPQASSLGSSPPGSSPPRVPNDDDTRTASASDAAGPPIFPIVAGFFLFAGALVLAFSLLSEGGTSVTGGRPKGSADKGLPIVSVDVVHADAFAVSQRVAGVVSAAKEATLKARVSGQVASVGAALGDTVAPNALLLTLDAGTLGPELERARAAAAAATARLQRAKVIFDDATAEYARRKRLVEKGAAATRTLRQAKTAKELAASDTAIFEAEMRKANAEVDIMWIRLEQTKTRAPFAGKISGLDVDVGTGVSAGAPLVTLVASGPPRVHFGLAESTARALSLGDKIRVWTDDGEAMATVQRIGASLSQGDRVRSIEAVFAPELEGQLLVGAFAEIEVKAEAPANTPVVAIGALRGRGIKRHAFVVDKDGTVHKVDVSVLFEDGVQAAVIGLKAGDVVIKAGGARVKDGDKVEVLK